jgi:F-type H+-transporting ATPase subunit c
MMIKARFLLMSALIALIGTGAVMAQAPGQPGAPTGSGNTWVVPALGSFAVAIAAFGAALADGRAISAACEGAARNPGAGGRIFTMLMLGLALIETLVLFTFLTVLIRGQ